MKHALLRNYEGNISMHQKLGQKNLSKQQLNEIQKKELRDDQVKDHWAEDIRKLKAKKS